MSRNDKIALIIFGAAAALATYKLFEMTQEKRKEFFDHIKTRTSQLLDKTDDTVSRVNKFMDEYDAQGEDAWIDKAYILKKMFRDLFGSEKHFLL